ncbi:SigE family RNA polymerase sigma factor [Actinoplanes subglobosus]|uniref:SigE family RNA polymerase sigma factor n=1 Tax=Actinoplanes subglobosus TaxID=1547892 RepID=A0ABV8J364_9ACTN
MTFESFVAEHGQALVRLAFVLTGHRQQAEDLTQSALVDAYKNWAKVSAARRPDSYVRRVLVNRHLSWRRRLWTTERPTELAEGAAGLLPDPSDALADRDHLRTMLADLAPRARTVLVLRYYADLSDAAIAETMGISESAVRSTASRALATLRARAAKQATVTPPPAKQASGTPPPAKQATATPPPAKQATATPPPAKQATVTPPPAKQATVTPPPAKQAGGTLPPAKQAGGAPRALSARSAGAAASAAAATTSAATPVRAATPLTVVAAGPTRDASKNVLEGR